MCESDFDSRRINFRHRRDNKKNASVIPVIHIPYKAICCSLSLTFTITFTITRTLALLRGPPGITWHGGRAGSVCLLIEYLIHWSRQLQGSKCGEQAQMPTTPQKIQCQRNVWWPPGPARRTVGSGNDPKRPSLPSKCSCSS